MNRVEITGGITKDAEMKTFDTATLLTYSVAVPGTKYNSQTREEEVTSTFVSVEQWISGVMESHHMIYKGDKVHVLGELTQYTKQGDGNRAHTRVLALIVTVYKRGRDGLAALSQDRPYVQAAQQPAPRQDDPWAAPNDAPEV